MAYVRQYTETKLKLDIKNSQIATRCIRLDGDILAHFSLKTFREFREDVKDYLRDKAYCGYAGASGVDGEYSIELQYIKGQDLTRVTVADRELFLTDMELRKVFGLY